MPYNIANIAGAVSQAEQDNNRSNLTGLQLQQGQAQLQQQQFNQSQQEAIRAAMAAGHSKGGEFDQNAATEVLRRSAPELIPQLQQQVSGQDEKTRADATAKIVTLGRLADKVVKNNGAGYDQFLSMAQQLAPGAKLPPTYDPQSMQAMVRNASALGGTTTLKEGDTQIDVMGNVAAMAPTGIRAQTLNETRRHNLETERLKTREISGIQASDQSDPNAPWKNVSDPKKRDEARMRFGVAADKRMESAQEEATKSTNVINNLDRFIFLNSKNETGARYAIPGAQSVAGTLSPEIGEMKSIVDLMTPMMRQGMPGAASDRDVAMFRGATVGLNKPREANENIATGLKMANQNTIDRVSFLNEYITQYGHDRGADAAWRKYLNANPIFDPLSPRGAYKINDKRRSYSEWAQPSSNQAPAQPATPTAPQAGQPSGPVKINSDDEYNRLPSGTTFIGPDGTTRRKP